MKIMVRVSTGLYILWERSAGRSERSERSGDLIRSCIGLQLRTVVWLLFETSSSNAYIHIVQISSKARYPNIPDYREISQSVECKASSRVVGTDITTNSQS